LSRERVTGGAFYLVQKKRDTGRSVRKMQGSLEKGRKKERGKKKERRIRK
jgi:hypothetical protein